MNRLYSRTGAFALSSALCLVTVGRLSAQTTAAPSAAVSPADETIELSPFIVQADEDQGYTAKDTLAGTRVRTELKNVASAISVVTKQFLQDTGAKNSQDLLVYTTNTEVGGLRGNFSGQGGQSVYQEALTNPNNTTRVRGLDVADNTRDYFLTDIPWDGFNVGRVDLQRGPNSILFGVGSPAGIINTSLNTASFKSSNKFENVTSSYGSQRNLVDFDYAILPNQLAVRFAAVSSQEKFKQDPAFNNSNRYYGAIRFDPKLFNFADSHTSFRANYEHGSVKSNNPRTLPPEDMITPFFKTGNDAYGNPNLNKLTINQYTPGFGNNSALVNSTYNKGGFAQGRTYWPTVLSYFNGSAANTPGVAPTPNSIPTAVISGLINTGWRIDQNGVVGGPYNPGNNPSISGLPNYRPLAIPDFQQYAANTNIPGGAYYADVTLSDPSIFDFYNKLLDGENKREWQKWNAFNVALSQTFFNDRLGFEVVYDQQSYTQGQVGFLQGVNYAINIDPNVTLADGSYNVNVGRPYVANSAASGNSSTTTDRNSSRFTGFADVRTEDYLGKNTLSKILGRHVFTVLANLDHKEQKTVTWSEYASSLDWEARNNLELQTNIKNYRQFDWVNYIGSSLLGASSAANANLDNIRNIIAPGASTQVRYFDSHWNKSTNPSDPNYVDPAAVYTYLHPDTAVLTTSTQSNNPANYVGWKQAPVTWQNANNPTDFPDLVTGGQRTKYRNSSEAFTWQGYLFNEDLAATFGWRKDKIVNYSTTAPVDGNTGVSALNYADNPSSRQAVEGQSRTWGAVYHLPKSIMSKLPFGTGLSFFYNKSANFKADAPRTDLAGQQIPNPDGDTKEYGFTLTALDEKLALKFGHYETTVHKATFNVTNGNSIAGLGGNGYWLWAAPSWGYGYAAQLQYGLDGKFGDAGGPQGNNWNYAYQDALAAGADTATLASLASPTSAAFLASPQYTQEKAIVNAWLNLPVSDNYFNYFGIAPALDPAKAHASGKLYDAFPNFPTGVGAQQPGAINSVSTVDNISKGNEIELFAQPIKNWNITINYAKTDATKTNIDPATVKFMADNYAFFNGPGGQLRLWGVGNYNSSRSQQIGFDWIQNVYNPYLVSALAAGQATPEAARWRLNAITTYTFDRGFLKSSYIGGAMRMEASKILGYRYDPKTLSLDVNDPLMGPKDTHYDLWVGYSRKWNSRVNWRIQLNFRNLGDKTELVPVRYQPDGTLALSRIQEGMTWQLTNTFEF